MRSWRGRRTRQWPGTAADTVRILSRSECMDIVSYLAGLSQSDVTTLTKALEFHMPAVSRSLNLLSAAGLVRYEKDAKRRLYSLSRSIEVEHLDNATKISIQAIDGSYVTIIQPVRVFHNLVSSYP